jgi:hypothetical protein
MKKLAVAFGLCLLMATGALSQGYYGGYGAGSNYPNPYGNPYVTDQGVTARRYFQTNPIGAQHNYIYGPARSYNPYIGGQGMRNQRWGDFGGN